MIITFFQILARIYPLKKIFLCTKITPRPSNNVLTWALIWIDPHYIKPDVYLLGVQLLFRGTIPHQKKVLESPLGQGNILKPGSPHQDAVQWFFWVIWICLLKKFPPTIWMKKNLWRNDKEIIPPFGLLLHSRTSWDICRNPESHAATGFRRSWPLPRQCDGFSEQHLGLPLLRTPFPLFPAFGKYSLKHFPHMTLELDTQGEGHWHHLGACRKCRISAPLERSHIWIWILTRSSVELKFKKRCDTMPSSTQRKEYGVPAL